jgi:dienelactone hydrolase
MLNSRASFEIPLEYFLAATDRLVKEGCNRIAYVGTSKGAEAALLVAADDPRIDAVVAISPLPSRGGSDEADRNWRERPGTPISPGAPIDGRAWAALG